MSERLTNSERNPALDRKQSFNNSQIEINARYEAVRNKSSIIAPMSRFISENEHSNDPQILGKVDAYRAFLNRFQG